MRTLGRKACIFIDVPPGDLDVCRSHDASLQVLLLFFGPFPCVYVLCLTSGKSKGPRRARREAFLLTLFTLKPQASHEETETNKKLDRSVTRPMSEPSVGFIQRPAPEEKTQTAGNEDLIVSSRIGFCQQKVSRRASRGAYRQRGTQSRPSATNR